MPGSPEAENKQYGLTCYLAARMVAVRNRLRILNDERGNIKRKEMKALEIASAR